MAEVASDQQQQPTKDVAAWDKVPGLRKEIDDHWNSICYVKGFIPSLMNTQGFFEKFETEAEMQVSRLATAGLTTKEHGEAAMKSQQFLHIVTDLLLKLHAQVSAQGVAPPRPAGPQEAVASALASSPPLPVPTASGAPAPLPGEAPGTTTLPQSNLAHAGAQAFGPGVMGTPPTVPSLAGPTSQQPMSLPLPSRGPPGGGPPEAAFEAGLMSAASPKAASGYAGGVAGSPAPLITSGEGVRSHWLLSRDSVTQGSRTAPMTAGGAGSQGGGGSGMTPKTTEEPGRFVVHGGPVPEPAAEPGTAGTGPVSPKVGPGGGGQTPGGHRFFSPGETTGFLSQGGPPPSGPNSEPLVLGQGSWARAYRDAAGRQREPFDLLFRVGIVTAREIANDDTLVANEHIEECRGIAEDMLRNQPLSFWTSRQTEAKNFFETQLTLLYTKKFGTPAGQDGGPPKGGLG